MNTSFSKYVKQCKWGLSLDTAGSDYSAHQLARLLTTILGRLPGPSARRWEESPVPAALGCEHLGWRRWAGKCRGVGRGGLRFPPGAGRAGGGGAPGWAAWHQDPQGRDRAGTRVTCAHDTRSCRD